MFLSYWSVNRLSPISWKVTLLPPTPPFSLFFLYVFLSPFTRPGNSRAAQLEFPQYEEGILLQGILIWEYLALDLTSPPLHYKNVCLLTSGLATKPIFSLLPEVAEEEQAEANIYGQLIIFVH